MVIRDPSLFKGISFAVAFRQRPEIVAKDPSLFNGISFAVAFRQQIHYNLYSCPKGYRKLEIGNNGLFDDYLQFFWGTENEKRSTTIRECFEKDFFRQHARRALLVYCATCFCPN